MDWGSLILALPAGVLLGCAFGALVQRSHFCTMGALADLALFGDWRRLRAWLLAIAVALIGVQALGLAGLVEISASWYAVPRPLSLVLAGGLVFGFGMTLCGGCASRTLVRLGAGSLKAALALALLAAAALASAGLLAVLAPAAWTTPTLTSPPGPVSAALAEVVGGLLLVFALADERFRNSLPDLLAGLGIGALAIFAWLIDAGFGGIAPTSLNFVAVPALAPLGDLPALALGLLLGVPLGAHVTARLTGTFRVERFTGRADLHRHAWGGVLMGVGAGLTLGCTIGHGVGGLATLALPSLVALTGVLAGAWLGLRYLEQGSLRGALRALLPGQGRA